VDEFKREKNLKIHLSFRFFSKRQQESMDEYTIIGQKGQYNILR